MNWYTPTLASYRLRTVRVGVHMTLAAVAVLTLYPLLPDHDIVDQRPYYLIIALAAFGVMVVALLPWEGLLQSGFGVWAFYVWSCLDIVLISGLVAITGGGDSEFFVLYTLTSMFFAASYPPRAHLALLLLTAGCYGGTLWLVGNGIGVAVFFVRISMLSLIIYMMRFLSHELMTQNASMAARELAMREQAAALDRMRLDAEHLATHDSLTGLLNRGAWFAEATRRSPTALAIIDVDHFKSINDRYGHLGGDEVLRVLAGQLASVLTPVGIVGRIGGEEFGVIFDTDPNAAERHCAAAVESIAVTPITTPRGAIDVTISAGLAEWTPAAHSREASLSQTYDLADQALYEAKRTGRRRLVVYPRPVEALALHGPRVSSPSV